MLSRRHFLQTTLKAGVVLAMPNALIGGLRQKITVGIMADLHQDIMHDGPERLQRFLARMQKIKPDAIMQLGDFAYPGDKNEEVIGMFNKAHENRMHVIGNHDTDAGYTKEQCVQYWGMPACYYAKEVNGVLFIILDANEKGSPVYTSGYPSFIGPEQMAWLKAQLEKAALPVVIVSHQPLAGHLAVDNANEVQNLLSAHAGKILLALNGHSHINAAWEINGVHYVHINSASYYWVGGKFSHESYPKEVVKDHEWIAYTCPYKEALFASLVIDPVSLTFQIRGSETDWVGMSPAQLGVERIQNETGGDAVVPKISGWTFRKR